MALIEKTGYYLAMCVIALLLFLIVFSENGIRDYQALTLRNQDVDDRIHTVRQQNRRLEQQILGLKQDVDYIKHIARHEHGMAEPGEFIFKEKHPAK